MQGVGDVEGLSKIDRQFHSGLELFRIAAILKFRNVFTRLRVHRIVWKVKPVDRISLIETCRRKKMLFAACDLKLVDTDN